MKRSLCLCLLALTIACIPLATAYGAPMTIVFSDGTTVTYDTDVIKSITFSGALPAASASTTAPSQSTPFTISQPQITEGFDSGLGDWWDPVAAVGGDFGRFARFEAGKFVADVPGGNSWGKTGIQSKRPVFTVDRSFETQPGLILIKTVPELTTGFVVALASAWHPDVWVLPTAWVHVTATTPDGEGSVLLINTQGSEKYGSDGYLPIKPDKAPEWIGLKVYPGKVALQVSGMREPIMIDMGWIVDGTPVYLQIFSHPRAENLPAAVAVDMIQVGR